MKMVFGTFYIWKGTVFTNAVVSCEFCVDCCSVEWGLVITGEVLVRHVHHEPACKPQFQPIIICTPYVASRSQMWHR